jgi:hypothetical protein
MPSLRGRLIMLVRMVPVYGSGMQLNLFLGLVWEPHFPKGFLFSQGKLVYFSLGK